MAAPLTIRIKKKADGSAALSCLRADGSVTWQRQTGPQGAFFPLHDLTHYAVETELGLEQAFYGLVASGWEFADFGQPWPRGAIPAQAGMAELIVGFLDTERASGATWTAAAINETAALHESGANVRLTDSELARIRDTRHALFDRWRSLPAGETLELSFPAGRP